MYDLFNIKKKITENPVGSQNITAPTPSQDSSVEYIISQRADKSQEKHSVDLEAEAEERLEQEAEGDTRLLEAQDVLRRTTAATMRLAAESNEQLRLLTPKARSETEAAGTEAKENPAGEGREKHLYAGAQSGNENQNSTRDLFNNVDTTSFKLNKKTDYPERKQIVIQSYIDSVDKKRIHFYRDALQEKNKKRLEWMHYTFGELPRSIMKKIDSLVGFNVSDFVITINGEAVNHINKRHGAYGKQDSTMKMDEDIGRMNYVITHADDVEYIINSSGKHVIDSQYRNRENTPSKVLSIRKRIDRAYYVIVAVPDNTAKRIVVKSAYLSEKTDDNQELSAKTLIATPEANLDVSSNKIVAQYAEKSQVKHSVDPEAEAEEALEREAEGNARLPEAQNVLRLLLESAIIRIAADKNAGNPLRESRRFFCLTGNFSAERREARCSCLTTRL